MRTIVGDEGQIVLEPEIRRQLGVAAGWEVRQVIAGDHLEIYFEDPSQPQVKPIPPHRSLRGAAKPFIRRKNPPANWDDVVGDSIARDF